MADDDPDDRYIIGHALSALSTVVKLRVVEDGEDLMNYLRGLGKYADRPLPPRPELILLDLNMPRKDGRQALADIKADPELKKIPVAIWTTSKESADRKLCKEAGADFFVTKPESYSELSNRLRELVERYCVE